MAAIVQYAEQWTLIQSLISDWSFLNIRHKSIIKVSSIGEQVDSKMSRVGPEPTTLCLKVF
jgi:hypothetical protein